MALDRHRRRSDGHSKRMAWASPPYLDIKMAIGKSLREQYELPKDMPHQLLTLLLEIRKSEDDS
jgi:hypothetical protein